MRLPSTALILASLAMAVGCSAVVGDGGLSGGSPGRDGSSGSLLDGGSSSGSTRPTDDGGDAFVASPAADGASASDAESTLDASVDDALPAPPEAGGPIEAGPPGVRFVARVDRSNPAAPR